MTATVNASALDGQSQSEPRHQCRLVYSTRVLAAVVLATAGACACSSVLTTDGGDFSTTSAPGTSQPTDGESLHQASDCLYELAVGWLLHEYPRRFLAFYAPKASALRDLGERALGLVWACDDVRAAVDFTAALVAVVSLFHLVETWRLAAIGKLRTAVDGETPAAGTKAQQSPKTQHD